MFRQTWRAKDGPDGHPLGTAIYYLLRPESYSHLHRLPTDEIYHFYLGDPVELYLFYPDGKSETVVLGGDLAAGQRPQAVAPGGSWQGSRLQPGGRYALLGTTMAPGFTPTDYEHALDVDTLKVMYPDMAAVIDAITGNLVY